MNNKENVVEIDLLQLAKVLWHRAWAIILAMVVFGAVAFSYAFFLITPQYQASAMLYVNNSSFSVGSTSVSLADLNASQSLVKTYAVILKTRSTLNEVIDRANLSYTYEQLYEMVEAAPVNSTEVFEIRVTSTDPYEAERIANTIAELMPEKISDIVEGSSVRIVDHAVVPAKKSAPSLSRYAAIGLLLGFVLSCGVIIVMELLDEQIRNEDYLLQNYDLPVLATVPDLLSNTSDSGYYKRRSDASAGKGAR